MRYYKTDRRTSVGPHPATRTTTFRPTILRCGISRPTSQEIGAGQDAARQLSVYSGRDCHSINGSELQTLEPWIGWTCQSEAGGQCDTVPISIKSFLVADASSINNGYPKCWDDAVMGGTSRARVASLWMVGVVVVAAVVLL